MSPALNEVELRSSSCSSSVTQFSIMSGHVGDPVMTTFGAIIDGNANR